MSAANWSLQRAYGSLISPQKGASDPSTPSTTYILKLDADFRGALTAAISGAARVPLSGIVLKLTDAREHPMRELIMKVAFGQTRTPLTSVTDLATRLSTRTDHRTGSSLLVTAVEESADRRRVSLYLFPEEESFTLHRSSQEAEAFLERLNSFVLQSRLRKVARFEGKEIKSHFLIGQVADFQIGLGPRTAADYWVTAFLEAEFAINEDKGTRLVADGLKRAFEKGDPDGKQAVMEAATALVANSRQVWSLERIANDLLPSELHAPFFSVVKNDGARAEKFKLSKELLRDRINYRVFRLATGVWVSSPFGEMGKSVKLEKTGGKRILTAKGAVESEKVQRDAKRPTND